MFSPDNVLKDLKNDTFFDLYIQPQQLERNRNVGLSQVEKGVE